MASGFTVMVGQFQPGKLKSPAMRSVGLWASDARLTEVSKLSRLASSATFGRSRLKEVSKLSRLALSATFGR